MYSIAIDGPAGAGKSSAARLLAEDLKFIYIDTGAMYRTAALWAIRNNISPKDEATIAGNIENINIRIAYKNGVQHMILNDEDVTSFIRTPEVSNAASDIAVLGTVRKRMVELQQQMALSDNVVMDGRDIGTVVLPKASVKIFLTASPEKRARRRFDELLIKGNTDIEYEKVLEDIIRRDYQDSHREISPLKKADDAVEFDNSDMGLQDTYDGIMKIVRSRIKV